MALVTEQMVERATKKLDDMYGPHPRPIVTSTIRDILTAALSAEPEAVPVAWRYRNFGAPRWFLTSDKPSADEFEAEPLYAAPPATSREAERRVVGAACDWWRSRRPLVYSEEQHFANPMVNTGYAESPLAVAVAALLREIDAAVADEGGEG